jgi:hypothetical protein
MDAITTASTFRVHVIRYNVYFTIFLLFLCGIDNLTHYHHLVHHQILATNQLIIINQPLPAEQYSF